jgi:sulfate adenylyltransferase
MTVEEIYDWDAAEVAQKVFGTQDLRHPLVAEMHRWGRLQIAGRLQVVQLPQHYDFQELRLTPAQTRARLGALGHANVVAFQTRNPSHRVHEELTKRAARAANGVLLLHPVVGLTKPGDVDYYTRVRTYKALVTRYYEPERVVLALLPLAMRLAGPREALWHALIRRNYGANHLIVGRDHASPGVDSRGQPFYGPYDVQELVERYRDELRMAMVPFGELVYLPDEERYGEASRVVAKTRTATLSGTQVREEYLNNGKSLPAWFTRREVVVCAAVSPYRAARQDVRNMVGADRFVEVFVDTPLEVCEQRDTKGMYAKARRVEIREFTGIDDPYEAPVQPEITLDTLSRSPEAKARRVLDYLIGQGFVRDMVAEGGDRLEPAPTSTALAGA